MAEQPTARYCPEIFDAPNLQRAKEVILTYEGPGADSDTRWALETPYVLELIRGALEPRPDTLVLDYGCGVGRMAKAMIEATGCSVIGVDISAKMRSLALEYVGSERFMAVSPHQFDLLTDAGLRVQAMISVWVLQHCLAPGEDIERLRRGLATGGTAFVLNMPERAVPAVRDEGFASQRLIWASDGIDVAALLKAAFQLEAEGVPDPSRTPNMTTAGAFWMKLRRG